MSNPIAQDDGNVHLVTLVCVNMNRRKDEVVDSLAVQDNIT